MRMPRQARSVRRPRAEPLRRGNRTQSAGRHPRAADYIPPRTSEHAARIVERVYYGGVREEVDDLLDDLGVIHGFFDGALVQQRREIEEYLRRRRDDGLAST